ncbi:palmitoyltransferase ZDHHC20-B-like [Amblyomma americanum]
MPRRSPRFHHPLVEWLPVVAVLLVFGGTYYVYVHVLCATMVKTVALRVVLVVAFHALFFLCAWSFAHTTLTDFAPIPVSFNVSASEKERLQSLQDFDERRRYLDELGDKRGVLTLGLDGCVRYCGSCGRIKPDRTHHCSWCGRCVPKMDHHCPWFNNCVSFTTQKSFLLTLVYGSLLAAFTATTSVVHAVMSWFSLGFSLATLSVSGLVAAGVYLSFGLGCFFSRHLDHLLRNITTLENMRATVFRDPDDSFDIGRTKNIVQVFGATKWLWALPVFTTPGDGVRFPTRLHPDPSNLRLPLVRAERDAPAASPAGVCPGHARRRGSAKHTRSRGEDNSRCTSARKSTLSNSS